MIECFTHDKARSMIDAADSKSGRLLLEAFWGEVEEPGSLC